MPLSYISQHHFQPFTSRGLGNLDPWHLCPSLTCARASTNRSNTARADFRLRYRLTTHKDGGQPHDHLMLGEWEKNTFLFFTQQKKHAHTHAHWLDEMLRTRRTFCSLFPKRHSWRERCNWCQERKLKDVNTFFATTCFSWCRMSFKKRSAVSPVLSLAFWKKNFLGKFWIIPWRPELCLVFWQFVSLVSNIFTWMQNDQAQAIAVFGSKFQLCLEQRGRLQFEDKKAETETPGNVQIGVGFWSSIFIKSLFLFEILQKQSQLSHCHKKQFPRPKRVPLEQIRKPKTRQNGQLHFCFWYLVNSGNFPMYIYIFWLRWDFTLCLFPAPVLPALLNFLFEIPLCPQRQHAVG